MIVTNGKVAGNGATMIQKREIREPGGGPTEKGIAQGGTLSKARMGWTAKTTATTEWWAAAMDKAVRGLNSRGFEVTSLKMENKGRRGASGDGIAALLEVMTGIEIGLPKPSKILSGWTRPTWTNQIKSIRMRTSRSSWSA
jgi:hypothetical protein